MEKSSKYKSRRWIISVWAVVMITTLSILSLTLRFEPSWMATTLPILSSIILAFVGMESWNKRLYKKE